MLARILSVILFLFCLQVGFSQDTDNEYAEDVDSFEGLKEEKKKADLSRIRIGGDFGLGFGNNAVFAEISPIVGYQVIRDRLELGPGLIYQHESRAKTYAVNNIGGQAYIRGYLWEGLFLQVDGFLVNFNYKDIANNRKANFTYGNGFVGAGYAINHKTAPFYFVISVKTNMVINKYMPTRRIIPKIGFQFRL